MYLDLAVEVCGSEVNRKCNPDGLDARRRGAAVMLPHVIENQGILSPDIQKRAGASLEAKL